MTEMEHPDDALMAAEGWTQEVLDAYGGLSMESLYEVVLGYERLAVEVRRQNKDLRDIAMGLTRIEDEISAPQHDEGQESDLLEELLDQEVLQVQIQQQDDTLLMLMDAMYHLLPLGERVSKEIALMSSRKKGLFCRRKKENCDEVHALSSSLVEGVGMVYSKLLTALADRNILPICPQQGERFVPSQHRAVEQVVSISENMTGAVARVVRLGYEKDGVIQRFADVAVYCERVDNT